MNQYALPILDGDAVHAGFSHELRRLSLSTLQINIGRLCNLACNHCHVESSPARIAPGENMDEATARRVVEWGLAHDSIRTIDFTGGSPELNPQYRWMVEAFRRAGRHVMTRCNPTVIGYRGPDGKQDYTWIPEFLAGHGVEIVASLPCYLEENVERQRGRGSYSASVEGLLALNAVGYGREPELCLNLVYNPVGPTLPPCQKALEDDYRRELEKRFGLVFNELWTITNMPIRRWRHELERSGQLDTYLRRLVTSFNEATLPALMCRHQINVGPDGRVYDCDFNLALGLSAGGLAGRRLWELELTDLCSRIIATGDHCYGCTAGAGSSCGGALT